MYPCPRTGPLLWQPEPQGPQLSGIDLRFFYPPPSDGGASMILLLCSAAKSRQVHIIYLQSTDGQSRWANAMKGWVLHGCLCWCWIGISPRKKVYGLAEKAHSGWCISRHTERGVFASNRTKIHTTVYNRSSSDSPAPSSAKPVVSALPDSEILFIRPGRSNLIPYRYIYIYI